MGTPGNSIYLNTAACGLLHPAHTAGAAALYARFAANSSTASEEWRAASEGRIRELIAAFIGAPAANVAMVPNFSWAFNAVVQSLKGTERVLLYDRDYPSLIEPFRINNFPITWVSAPDGFHFDVDAIRNAITSRSVDVVALSHVQWNSGYKIDLREIGALCHRHGVRFLVDGTQSLGANIIDLASMHVDVFAASNYKWMNAAFGTGILYISNSFLQQYPPVVGGHNSYKMAGNNWKYVPSIISYEPGHPNMFGLLVLEAAIKQKMELGMVQIATHNAQLCQLLLDGIKTTPVTILGTPDMRDRAPFAVLVDEHGLGDRLQQHNIVVTRRNGLIRVSTHFYNTKDDVRAFTRCIREWEATL